MTPSQSEHEKIGNKNPAKTDWNAHVKKKVQRDIFCRDALGHSRVRGRLHKEGKKLRGSKMSTLRR